MLVQERENSKGLVMSIDAVTATQLSLVILVSHATHKSLVHVKEGRKTAMEVCSILFNTVHLSHQGEESC